MSGLQNCTTVNQTLNLLSQTSTIKQAQQIQLLSDQQQAQLSRWYYKIFKQLHSKGHLTQHALITILRAIRETNIRLGINVMSIIIWNKFFEIYYQLPQQFRDSHVCKILLSCMKLRGIQCSPNLGTFRIILKSLATGQFDQNRMDIFIYIIQEIMMHEYQIQPDNAILQLQFKVYSNNLDIYGSYFLTKFIMNNPDTIFNDCDINIFNIVLAELPNIYFDSQGLARNVEYLMNIIIGNHGYAYNEDTYSILTKLWNANPDWSLQEVAPDIYQPNRNHDSVFRIVKRFEQLQIGKDTVSYNNLINVSEKLGLMTQMIPDPYRPYSKRDWDYNLRTWRKCLHMFDTVHGNVTILQQQVIAFQSCCSRSQDNKTVTE